MGMETWSYNQNHLKEHGVLGGGRGVGGNGDNCGTCVRASISKPTPFIYLAFEKTDPFIYLVIRNADLFIYCPLIFLYPFIAGRQISQSIHWIPREQAASKNLWAKIFAYTRMSEKWGLSHKNPEKYFLMKKGGQSYTWQRWKRGPFGMHSRTMPYIGSYPYPRAWVTPITWGSTWNLTCFWGQKCLKILTMNDEPLDQFTSYIGTWTRRLKFVAILNAELGLI